MNFEEKIKCSVCNGVFIKKKYLYAHLRRIHKIEPNISRNKPTLKCHICSKLLSTEITLRKHLKSFHPNENDHIYVKCSRKTSRLLCPVDDCSKRFPNYRRLRVHLGDEHLVDIETENLEFNSIEDFENWKSEEQQQTLSLYTLDTATKKLSAGVKKQYFNCHRSYTYKPKGKNIRSLKSNGSYKMGKVCPARMEVTIVSTDNNEECIQVKYYKTHYGHLFDLEHLTLDKQSRAEIAGQLLEGESFDQILGAVKEKSHQTDCNQRLSRLQRKDLLNIVRDYNIDYKGLTSLRQHIPLAKLRRIISSHKLSHTISPDMITSIKDKEWLVCSTADILKTYHVTYVQEICLESCLKCQICNICVHSFKCSCNDSLINFNNICKHIHACAQLYFDSTKEENANAEINYLHERSTGDHCSEKIIKRAQIIIDLSNNVSVTEENCFKIEHYLGKVINILNRSDTIKNVNVKNAIRKQHRFYSPEAKITKIYDFDDF